VTALLLAGVHPSAAQVVTFSEVTDAVPTKFFDAATSQPNPLNANELLIGLNTGFDFQTWTTNDFRASTLPFSNRTAADTLKFVVTAPDGFYISKITYTQRGTASFFRGSVQSGTAQWVVDGFPASLGVFSNPNLTGTADLTTLTPQSVTVSITVSLFAAASGNVSITNGSVLVEVAPRPVETPAADSAPPDAAPPSDTPPSDPAPADPTVSNPLPVS
jgi:hypothetical protein